MCERVVDEKVGDGQLSECDLTLGDLTNVKDAFVDALVGHYHQRIPYPNFPGGTAPQPEIPVDHGAPDPNGPSADEPSDEIGASTQKATE